MSYSACDFLNDCDSMADIYNVPALDFGKWCAQSGEDATDDSEAGEELQQRFLAERIGNALWERRELIRQRNALAAALREVFHEILFVEDEHDSREEFDSMLARAHAALAIKNPEVQP